MRTRRPVILTLVLLSALAAPSLLPAQEASLVVGNHAPPLEVFDLAGNRHLYPWTSREEEASLFFFFDIASPEGLYGLTILDRLSREAGDFGLRVFALESSGQGVEAVTRALERYRAIYPETSLPVGIDGEGKMRRLFGVGALPSLALLERHGVILDQRREPGEGDWGEITAIIRQLIHLPEGVLADLGETERKGSEEESEEPVRPLLFPGEQAPSFEILDLEGVRRTFSWPTDGEGLTILFFWGDPCRPCIREMLFLDQLYRRASDLGLPLRVIAAGTGGVTAERAGEVLDRLGTMYPVPSYPLTVDGDSRLLRTFGRGKLPSTFFLDGEGTIVIYVEGFDEEMTTEWIDVVEREVVGAAGLFQEVR